MDFESDGRRFQVHLTLFGLNIDHVISDSEEVLDESESLNWIFKRIKNKTLQCPEVRKTKNSLCS